MRGRPPRPREEKIREGKTRNLPEPVMVSGRAGVAEMALRPPASLHLNRDAREWWAEVVPTLAEAGLLERVDAYVLAMAAKSWGDVMAADRVIAVHGYFAPGSTGQPILAPWIKMRRDAMMMFERYLNHLALSPVARTRLGLARLQGHAMARELERELGVADSDVIPGEIVEDVGVGVPGLPR